MLHNIFVDVDQKHIIVVDLLIKNKQKLYKMPVLNPKLPVAMFNIQKVVTH